MHIETLVLSDITPYESDAKKHFKYQIDQIKEPIKNLCNNTIAIN